MLLAPLEVFATWIPDQTACQQPLLPMCSHPAKDFKNRPSPALLWS